ncbi:MAG TPA: FtsX-like permease family protein [Bryobacteraceae bacterium]
MLSPAANGLSYLRNRFSKPLRVVFVMVAIGLLLACINVMSLEFARARERRHELSVRLAIGAGRVRVIRQLVAESVLLALGGGLLGLAICRPAAAALTTLISYQGAEGPNLPLRVDSRVLLFILAISIASAIVCGLVPAWRATRAALLSGLQQGSRSASVSPVRPLLGRLAVALQLTLSIVLIAAAFLFAFSLQHLIRYDTGLNRRALFVLDLDTREAGYQGAAVSAFNRRLLDKLSALPGVEAVTFSEDGLYSGRNSNGQMGADGFSAPPGKRRNAYYDHVGPRYFTTLGARILAGRDFDDRDNAAAPRVAIISQEFARHFFRDRNPIGLSIYYIEDPKPLQVVGVVGDIRARVRRKPESWFYLPQFQKNAEMFSSRFLVRSRLAPSALAPALRAAVRSADPSVPILSIDSADDLLNRTLDLDRLVAALSFAFGVLAAILAAVGIYGLLAYEVTRRTGEIGIRVALGLTRAGVVALVFREVALVGAIGMAAGAAAALALGRLVEGMVFELKPGDPRVLAAAALLLAVVAAGAAWFPARRAARLDPITALRHD